MFNLCCHDHGDFLLGRNKFEIIAELLRNLQLNAPLGSDILVDNGIKSNGVGCWTGFRLRKIEKLGKLSLTIICNQ